MMSAPSAETAVLVRMVGRLGRLTLNRPRVLNALNREVIHTLARQLREWADSPHIDAVLIDGAGSRGLSAGGDLREFVGLPFEEARDLLAYEYRMDAEICRFPKPYIAIMSGVTMGGGVGLSAHGSARIVTETTLVAMPEVRVGLAPDVGANWILSRSPGRIGEFMAMTGSGIGAADAIAAGFADAFLPESQVTGMIRDLEHAPAEAMQVVQQWSRSALPPEGALSTAGEWIDECFAGEGMADILDRLQRSTLPEAASAAARIAEASPFAVGVALAAVRRARVMTTVDEVFAQDLRVSSALIRRRDLREGVDAALVRRDRRPRWRPADMREIVWNDIERVLAGTTSA